MKSRSPVNVLVINDNAYGLTILNCEIMKLVGPWYYEDIW